jgi:serine protease Do
MKLLRMKQIAVLLLVLACTAPLFAGGKKEAPAAAQPATTIVINDQGGFTEAITRVSEVLMPAVVHIETSGSASHASPGYSFGPLQHQPRMPVRSLGSGVIISPEGHIITNNHLVEDAQSIVVELYGGERRKATLVGRDAPTDIAVIKIETGNARTYARFGDSDTLKVGEWVIAIGSPRGLDWTVTAGIVSAKHRTDIGALGPSGFEDFIQTDASINPGNSGGPLINLKGEVVGINSLIVSDSQGSEGLGFAIPSHIVQEISNALISGGKVVRGYIGIDTEDLDPDLSAGMGLPESTRGAIVDSVEPSGPAAAVGVREGDIVVGFNGKSVDSAANLRAMVAASTPGSSAGISILRKGVGASLTARVEDLETASARLARLQDAEQLGLTVQTMTQELARLLGLRRAVGVVVMTVAQGSAASRAQLDPGDVVLMVGDSDVADAQSFSVLLAEAVRKGQVVFLIRDVRTGQIGFLEVPLTGVGG